MNILLVEDDTIIASGLKYALENENFIVTHTSDIHTATKTITEKKFDLAILDVGLPDGLGFELIPLLKSSTTPILFLTAVDDEGNIVKAFESGANDYVTKPFRLGELKARIKSILRHHSGQENLLNFGNLKININEGKVYSNEKPIELTALEYRLLLTFANHKGKLLSRGQILNLLWDSEGIFVEDNTLTVYVKRLREKIGAAAKIETVRGMGYRANDS